MADLSLGASAPDCAASGAPLRRTLYRVPASSRTRHLTGVCLAGDMMLCVYSTRRDAAARCVSITLHDNTASDRTGHMSPADARALAQALVTAAGTADAATHGEG